MHPRPTSEQFLPPALDKTADGCKAGLPSRLAALACYAETGSMCATHAPEGRGVVRRLRVNYRYYNPTDGRWTRRDPIGEREMDTTLYVYCLNNSVDNLDLLGLLACCSEINKPGNKSRTGTSTDMVLYLSAEEAARAAIRKWNPISISENHEYGGQICECIDSLGSEVMKYFYTYKKGKSRSVTLTTIEVTCPIGTRRAATWHTHASTDEAYKNEEFSGDDIFIDNFLEIPGYLGTPKGKFKRHTPHKGIEELEP